MIAVGCYNGYIYLVDAATFKVKRLSRGHSQDNQDCMCKHENGEDGDEYESNPGCPEAGHSHEVSKLVVCGGW